MNPCIEVATHTTAPPARMSAVHRVAKPPSLVRTWRIRLNPKPMTHRQDLRWACGPADAPVDILMTVVYGPDAPAPIPDDLTGPPTPSFRVEEPRRPQWAGHAPRSLYLGPMIPRDQFVSAIPEPSTWWFMITGFGVVGGMMRYRRTRSR